VPVLGALGTSACARMSMWPEQASTSGSRTSRPAKLRSKLRQIAHRGSRKGGSERSDLALRESDTGIEMRSLRFPPDVRSRLGGRNSVQSERPPTTAIGGAAG
jgi:hypothetical protein